MKKLNWSNAIFIFMLCGLASLGNKNNSIFEALILWLVFGVPVFLFILIAGKENE